MDLVGTCPKTEWNEWLAEGGCAGDLPPANIYPCFVHEWATRSLIAKKIKPGDRFYVVSHGKLRGYAPVVRVDESSWDDTFSGIIRGAGAAAVTIPTPIPGFQGLRKRWWDRADEIPFPEWKKP